MMAKTRSLLTWIGSTIGRQFRNQADTALAIGIIYGFVAACEAATPRHRLVRFGFTFWCVLVLAPGIANRSIIRILVAPVSLVAAGILPVFFIINGRLSLPLSVWHQAPIMVPGWSLSWPWRAIFSFVLFWFPVNIVQALLHRFEGAGEGRSAPPVRVHLKVAFWSATGTLLVSLGLFVLSWQAFVTGTFVRPLYTSGEYYWSLICYGACYPANLFLVHRLYEYQMRAKKNR